MAVTRLTRSEFARDEAYDLAPMLGAPADEATIVKDEPRTVVWRTTLPSGAAGFVKSYRHRSLYDFTRESLTRFRVQREFDALCFLARRSIPCARPICWGRGQSETAGRFETLVTFERPDTVGLKDWLRTEAADGRWIEPAARLLRQAHEAGFYHGALAPRNLLLRPAPKVACYFIDTPKSIVFPRSVVGTRMARHDLMVFLGEIARVTGAGPLPEFLATYGTEPAAITRLVEAALRYRPNRNTRARMRAEFLIRRAFG